MELRKLNLDELIGTVNLYPWFAGARKELCVRMMRMGGDAWGEGQYADAALHMPSRRVVADMLRASTVQNLEDSGVEDIIKSYIADKERDGSTASGRRTYAGAGDYFSQEDYDNVKRTDDNVFSRYASKARGKRQEGVCEEPVFDLFTETLAQIYAEQGYYEQAKDIYSKLILAYPEKNAYFAALIQKMDELK